MKKIQIYNNISGKKEILSTIYFFSLLFFLPFCTLITFLEPVHSKELSIFFFARQIILLFSIAIIALFYKDFKLNYNLVILLIIFLLYLFNYNYGDKVNYDNVYFTDYLNYLNELKEDLFYNKKKYNIISAALILHSIITIFFISSINERLLIFFVKIIFFFFLMVIFLKIYDNYNLIINNFDEINKIFSKSYVNINGLLVIPFFYINLFFLKKKKKFIEYIILFLSLAIIIFFKSRNFFFCSFVYLIIIYYLERKIKKYSNKLILTKLLIFFLFIFYSQIENFDNKFKLISNIYKFNIENHESSRAEIASNQIESQIRVRLDILNFYWQNKNNFGEFFGNSIFNNKLPSYPHNVFMDIYYCTGLFGLMLFIFLIFKIFFNIKIIYTNNKLSFLIFFQLFLLANFFGFFFINISLIASLTMLYKLNEIKLKNKKISFG
jgi:hypothetical protein